jgi:hypothetical protein
MEAEMRREGQKFCGQTACTLDLQAMFCPEGGILTSTECS